MVLSRVIKSAITKHNAPDKADTAIASSAMKTSATAITALGKGSVQNSGKIAAVVPLLNGSRIDQNKAHTVGVRLGQIKADAAAMKALKPIVVEAAKAWESAEKDRSDMAKAIATAAQKNAVLNSKTQSEMFQGHFAASTQVAYHQAAYGGFAV